ncbi:diacylglycerol O-acyltransferase 1 [Rhodotorula toruloides]|uniref:Diacylglycerol O-acyltransferase n=2 Tax=Rhodotorula toruloides TaxID=5286 RepID=C6KZS6_RHOTO|nr:2-acylglycerol O-acyltransferase 2 [Rhodotorula toruloides NP11]EMS21092.1 2-acylglycerol O-acyltransferase 2 [Rhodotorula toruloides NP11]BAH85840.1 diacylglycerol acyltransferase [Rhodotorula toruloides]CDR39395.1 RHTO0S04e04720g1_1 [Rhodotorula toruloides]
MGQQATPEELYTRSEISKIKFAPFGVPRSRRLQTFSVFAWTTALPILLGVFFLLCSFPPLWPAVIAYLTWVFFIDQAPIHGGRAQSWLRKSRIWVWFAGYYPVSLIKSADLPPDRKYVFGYHPHGVIGMGAIANFATDATGFSTLFPGLNPHLLTLQSNFKLPLYRELLLALGICSVSMKSCQNILRQGPGSALTIVVGGAAESLSAHPGTADLTLKRRKGFIKLAIRQGADLVPVFSFGENDIFGQLRNERGTRLYKLQKRFQGVFGFTLPLFYGRGLFNYNVGLMPYRHPIVSVVGRPISVEQKDHPTTADLEEVQARYIAELKRIWEEYKDAYAKSRTRELNIIA